jgi:ubiquinone/menaquinone biosynthesis C-methylase UbiE
MFTALLHRIVAQPLVYDLAQNIVGAKQVRRRLDGRIAPHRDAKVVVDIGGGTGSVAGLWSASSKYICLDIDPLKLEGFVAKNPTGTALLADAARIPIADHSIDVVLCTNVTHHLTDDLLDRMLGESARVLTAGGKLILSDAIWAPDRRIGRAIWKYDRGSFPRTADILQAAVAKHLAVTTWDQFAIWHEYFVCVAGRKI